MTAFVWDGTANNWASNHWGRGGVSPVYPGDTGSAVTDTIYLDATVNPPNDGVLTPFTVASYIAFGLNFPNSGDHITVTSILTIGLPAGTDEMVWNGTASPGCVVLFQAKGIAGSDFICGDNATFNDDSDLDGEVGDYATFNDRAYATGTIGNYATFNDDVIQGNGLGICGHHATFNDRAAGSYDVVVDHHATFNDAAQFLGTVRDYATFNDESYNNTAVSVGDYATFNSSAIQDGVFTGTHYTITAETTFADTCSFTGGTVTFTLTNPDASIIGKLTTDGGTTPLEHNIVVDVTAWEAARNVDPGVANVLLNTTYKIAGADSVGELVPQNVVVSPVSVLVNPGEASAYARLVAYQHCPLNYTLTITDQRTGVARDLTGKSLRMQFYTAANSSVELFYLETGGNEGERLVVGGNDGNSLTVEGPATITATAGKLNWRILNITDDDRIEAAGQMIINPGPAIPVPV